jgi:hypothetical protein
VEEQAIKLSHGAFSFGFLSLEVLGSNQALKGLGVTYFVDLHPIFYLAGTGSRMEATTKV